MKFFVVTMGETLVPEDLFTGVAVTDEVVTAWTRARAEAEFHPNDPVYVHHVEISGSGRGLDIRYLGRDDTRTPPVSPALPAPA